MLIVSYYLAYPLTFLHKPHVNSLASGKKHLSSPVNPASLRSNTESKRFSEGAAFDFCVFAVRDDGFSERLRDSFQ